MIVKFLPLGLKEEINNQSFEQSSVFSPTLVCAITPFQADMYMKYAIFFFYFLSCNNVFIRQTNMQNCMNVCKEGSSLEHCRCLDGKLQIELFKCVQETTQFLESLLNNSSTNYGNQIDDIYWHCCIG